MRDLKNCSIAIYISLKYMREFPIIRNLEEIVTKLRVIYSSNEQIINKIAGIQTEEEPELQDVIKLLVKKNIEEIRNHDSEVSAFSVELSEILFNNKLSIPDLEKSFIEISEKYTNLLISFPEFKGFFHELIGLKLDKENKLIEAAKYYENAGKHFLNLLSKKESSSYNEYQLFGFMINRYGKFYEMLDQYRLEKENSKSVLELEIDTLSNYLASIYKLEGIMESSNIQHLQDEIQDINNKIDYLLEIKKNI